MENQSQTALTSSHFTTAPPQTELTTERLDEVIGGLTFTFKLVAVKTVSWAHDD